MNKYIEDVKKFHETFGHPINNSSDAIDLKTRQLRIKLLFEELEELSEASDTVGTFQELCLNTLSGIEDSYDHLEVFYNDGVLSEDGDNVDKIEELDALCDIQYVLSGAVLAMGHQNNFDNAFQNVQDSNMSKGCKTIKEVEDTIIHYSEKGVESYYVRKGDIFIVLRKEDNKVLKNVNYIATDLKQFVNNGN